MPSLRQDSVDGSDWLHRIRGYIPGFQGYDTREGFSDSDRMVRMMIVQKVTLARKDIESTRSVLAQADLADVGNVDFIDSALKRVATALSYSDSGYGWLSKEQDELGECCDRLCESDAHLIEEISDILRSTGNLLKSASYRDAAASKRLIGDLTTKASFLEDTIRIRDALIRKIRC